MLFNTQERVFPMKRRIGEGGRERERERERENRRCLFDRDSPKFKNLKSKPRRKGELLKMKQPALSTSQDLRQYYTVSTNQV